MLKDNEFIFSVTAFPMMGVGEVRNTEELDWLPKRGKRGKGGGEGSEEVGDA